MYKFFITPGHGYLQVPHKEIIELGIYDKISRYSFRKLENKVWYALLEEDCDAPLFVKAWEAKHGKKLPIKELFTEELHYSPHWPNNLQAYK